jgi:hypothetical protein
MLVLETYPLICLEMVDSSASKLELLRIEFWPNTISELVQSMKGFIYDSSSVDFIIELFGVIPPFFKVKNLSGQDPSKFYFEKWIYASFSFSFLMVSCPSLVSSSTKMKP